MITHEGKICRLRKKGIAISSILLPLLILIFLLNCSSVLAYESFESDPLTISIDEKIIIELEKIVLTDDARIRLPLENHISIKYPENDITIVLPDGSTIMSLSNTSIDIKLVKGIKTIDFSETVAIFTPINFYSSIDGLDDFTVKISYANCSDIPNINGNITTYTIDWENNEKITGNGIPSSTLTYTYKKEGTYPITINFTDRDGITYSYITNQTFELTTEQFVELWVDENKETIAVGSTATVSGIAILGIIFTETGKYKFLTLLPLIIPMYTRIQKEDVLDQFVRGKIYGFIKGNPGVYYNQVMRELDMENGTLSYHLYMLEKTGMIKSRKEGLRYRVFYTTAMKFPEEERYRLTELQLKILKIIKENKGISQKEIAKMLNEKHQTISYNVKILKQARLIDVHKKGRRTSCHILKEPTAIAN